MVPIELTSGDRLNDSRKLRWNLVAKKIANIKKYIYIIIHLKHV